MHVKQRKDVAGGETREVTSDDEANLILRFTDGEFVEDATANVSTSMVEYPSYQNRVEIFGASGATCYKRPLSARGAGSRSHLARPPSTVARRMASPTPSPPFY